MANHHSPSPGQSPENRRHLLDPEPTETTPPWELDEQFNAPDAWEEEEPDPAATLWEPLELDEDDEAPEPDDGDFWIERDDAND